MSPRETASPDAPRRRSKLRSLASEGGRMALLSLASLGLGYALTLALHSLGLPVSAAYACSVLICTVLNFFGCRHFVFRGNKPPLWQEAAKFFPSLLVFRLIEVSLFSILTSRLGNYHLSYFATAGISMVLKLILSRVFIFKRTTE